MSTVLEVSNLSVDYAVSHGYVRAVDQISFELEEAEVLGLAGESGCGKTTAALSLLRILPKSTRITGSVRFNEEEVLTMADERLRNYRWKDVALVPQSSMNALIRSSRSGRRSWRRSASTRRSKKGKPG